MKAVVMAGGAGSRLRPLTVGRPKPIVPIVNKPVIGHIRDLLCRHDIREFIVTLQYMPDQIQDYLGDGSDYGMSIKYSVEEAPLGTAGSVKNAQSHLDDTFLVISGDAVTDLDIGAVVAWHKAHQAQVTLVLRRVKEPPEYGVVITDGEGRVRSFQEKPSWGEVMSDTVNTGIYILEPSVLDYIPHDTPFDFSKDLFPRLLELDEPMYGYITQDYWTDVGNLAEYMQATADVLRRAVKGIELGEHIGGDIWTEGDVEIAPDAQLYGPIFLGHGVKIKGKVIIQGPTVIRPFTVIDNRGYIDRSIIWRNCYIGEMAEVRGAIICRSCNLKSRTVVYEGAVLGDGTSMGEGAVIHPNVKIWPGKAIDGSTSVRNSIIWGSQGRRTLFSRFGVSGLVNVDLTPEFAARLGAAYASTLPRDATVTINRDVTRSAQMLKRALIAGLPSAGINALDTKSVPIPVLRYYTANEQTVGGIHIRISPFDSRVVDIRFYDSEGMNLSKSTEREIERVFFREDYRRVYLDEIGQITDAPIVTERYTEGYFKALDVNTIRGARYNLVVDCANASASAVLPSALTDLHCSIVALNAQLDENRMSITRDEFEHGRDQLRKITQTLNADLGVRLDVGGERVFIVDDQGRHVSEIQAAAALAWLALRQRPKGVIVVPVTAPHIFEQIAAEMGGEVWRTRLDPAEMMRMARREEVILAADGLGNLIFPTFHPSIDGLFAVAKLIELLAFNNKIRLSEVVDRLPNFQRIERRVDCPWDSRGTVMRRLHERFGQVRNSLVEGVQLSLGEREWVLMLPNPDEPFVNLYAEADSTARATMIAEEYANIVRGMMS
ncbi:MAG: NTP transferase domain-containing protein [Anaerolineae bacterium]|nr:NTP transferase domain-containing protein [Anaerolineae bacterium]